ncbi:T9SS type A sorting domain-containing protein [Polaribacter sp. Hel1_85]|uniref:T9SS type A sorting domain-containing protein n=1 Tax=Polaribacter sp. Hel1_85 TaxID=1250005 RepID=UPI00056029A8|nr:T9SS type A sorting domain-containing protein [Polaribacter sp. Hel1_85]
MKKKVVFILVVILGVWFLCFNVTKESKIELIRKKYSEFRQNHPYNKTKALTKKERKKQGLPPNAYFEQEYLNELNPITGKTYPENIFELQEKLTSEKTLSRTPGDETDNPWIERGPNNVGGRTRALLFDPNDVSGKRVFAGGVSGGLWVNDDITDADSAWQQVGVSENLAITCITVDPNNSKVIYVGTGESYTNDNGVGNGIWKSTDGGSSWANVFNITSSDISSKLYFVNTILAWNNPVTNKTEVFAGIGGAYYNSGSVWAGSSNTGLYKTVNDGANWSKLTLNTPEQSPYEPNDLEVGADNTIWMGTERNNYGHGGGTILKSTDGTNFTVEYTIADGRRTELAVSKQNSNTIFVLASGGSTPIFMLKTVDRFTTTSNMAFPNDVDTGIPANDFTRGQAYYDLVVETDPTNDAILYVGGIDLFRSTDSGSSWKQMSKWHSGNQDHTYFLDSNLPVPTVHADQHVFIFHPTDSNKAIIGNDGGVYYASSLSDAEETTSVPNTSISSRNKEYNTLQFYTIGVAPTTAFSGDYFLAGAQDNGTQFFQNSNATIDGSVDVSGGDGAYSFFDQDGTDKYFIVNYVYNNIIQLYDFNTGEYRTINEESPSSGNGDFINTEELDSNLDMLYSNYSNGTNYIISRYSNLKSGTVIKVDLTNDLMDAAPSAMKVSSFTTNSSTLLVGLGNGKLLKINNANDALISWSEITGPEFVGSISDIEFGISENEIFVTMHNYGVNSIWYTSDGGVTWASKEGDFPDIPVKTILQNPLRTEEVIIGTELGVWKTSDFTADSPIWVQSDNGMSNVKVTDLDLRDDNTIFAATYGRGVFSGEFTAETASINNVLANKKVFTIYPTISKGDFTLQAKNSLGKTKMDIFNITGKQVYSKNIDFTLDEKQEISVNLNTGVYIVNIIDENNKKSSNKIVIE